jgi:hypothetical protein
MKEAPELQKVIALLRDAAQVDLRKLSDEQACERAALIEDAGRLIDLMRVPSLPTPRSGRNGS